MNEITFGNNNNSFDMTRDSAVDLVDRDAWLETAATANGFSAPFDLGDVTLDGRQSSAG